VAVWARPIVIIDTEKCVACGNCTYVCPMGAIYVDLVINRATIERDECVECYSCYNGMSKEHLNPTLVRLLRRLFKMARLRFDPEPDVCPTSALTPDELTWPRLVRRAFSDPLVPHESTGVSGRGTEEVKTNDLTGRVKRGEVNFTIELGRPGVGVRMYDIEKMTMALAKTGVAFEKKNPITSLMPDPGTGALQPEILNEKILSAIIEVLVKINHLEEIIGVIRAVEKQVKTVVVIGAGVRCNENGEENDVAPILERLGFNLIRAKTNFGLGRITNEAAQAGAVHD
jgi:ferredoxin